MGKIYLGCKPSVLNGTEKVFQPSKTLVLPGEYSFQNQMPPVLNQGSTNMCVTYAVASHIDWNINMDKKTKCKDNNVDRKSIYSARTVAGDNGMTIKEAMTYVKNTGVKTNIGLVKIDNCAKIGSVDALKQAVVANGPCVGGLMCYGDYTEFWKKGFGQPLGGHAISIVGYTKDGFIIRNSWGTSYGKGGYALMKYADFSNFFELWTIID